MRLSHCVGLFAAGLLCLVGGDVFGQAKDSSSTVKVNVTAEKPGADGKQVILIDLDIEKDWHAYANPVNNDMFASNATKVAIEGKNKLADVKFDYPAGKLVVDKDVGNYMTYEGKVQIKATVKRGKDDGPLKVVVSFQTCNDGGRCLLRADVEKKVE